MNSTPTAANALDACGRFGGYGDGPDCLGTSYGGALVQADAGAQLAVVVRVVTPQSGEDYSGIAVP